MRGRNLRIGMVTGAIALALGLYLLPKKPFSANKNTPPPAEAAESSSSFSFEKFVKEAKMKAGWNTGNKAEIWEQQIREGKSDPGLYDSLAASWDMAKSPGIAAWYFEQKSEKLESESSRLNAAYRYFDAFKASRDSAEADFFLDKAIRNYTRVLELNPGNLDAKTDLGILYAEGTGAPMKGITLLREVVAENPGHENAQVNLGFLSMKSGQYDKAVERFDKVLAINPGRIDMYIYKGEALVRMKRNSDAIESFKVFTSLSNDRKMIEEVNQYIESLKAEKRTVSADENKETKN